MTTAEEHVLAEARRITDKDSGWRTYEYPPTGEQLDSVTTVISATNSKPWLQAWYGRTSMIYAVDNIDLLAETLAADGRDAAIALGKDEAQRIRDLKADAGTHVHDVQERLILWAASPEGTGHQIALPSLPEHLEGVLYDGEPVEDVIGFMVDGFLNFVADFNPEFLAAEMAVYNQPLGVAGTLDMIIRLVGYAICDDPACEDVGAHLVECPGNVLVLCIDSKTGKSPDGTWKEQLAAYRRMKECRLPLGDVAPMPHTDAGAVLHLRPEYPDGYLLMLVAGKDDAAAWQRFQDAAGIYRDRQKVKDKPGKVIRALRPDGTMPGPRICDLAGEGYGRALAPLAKALGADAELEQVARFTAAELLAIKGIGPKLLDTIRKVVNANGLVLRDDALMAVAHALQPQGHVMRPVAGTVSSI